MVMSWRQSTVAAFHSRRGALQSRDLLCGPRLPSREDMRGAPLGDGVLVKRGAHLCPSSLHRGFPPCAARVSSLMFPIDPWKQRLPRPLPPWRGDGRLRPILADAFPPKIHQCGEGGPLVTDLRHTSVTYGSRMVLGSCCNGGDFSLQPAVDWGGGLRTGVVEVQRMQREGERLKVGSIRPVPFLPSLHGRPLHLHVTLGCWVT